MDERSEPSCCQPVDPRSVEPHPVDPRIARAFDRRASVAATAASFPQMVDVSALLLAQLNDVSVLRPTVLEFGCGTGALSVALLERGAQRTTGLDLSTASLDIASRRAAAAGLADRATFMAGNAAATTIEPHDWVILDRSICCFPDVDGLLVAAIAAARHRIAITVPESRGWRGVLSRVRLVVKTGWDTMHGGCRSYVHDVNRIEATLAAAGFRPRAPERVHLGRWLVATYQR